MSERLAEIVGRIQSLRQLDSVVNAMTGLAAARAREARERIAAADLYAEGIARAMAGLIEAGAPAAPAKGSERGAGGRALILFCAEHGFAGAFSERMLDAVAADLEGAELFLVGTRAAAVAAQRGLVPRWTAAMPAHAPAIPAFADRLLARLYPDLAAGRIARLDAAFMLRRGGREEAARLRLAPLDPASLPKARGEAPLIQLDRAELLAALDAECMHARLCRATLHALAAENEARMAAMSAARAQIERELEAEEAVERRVRQEATTAEIIELAAGEEASGRRG